MSAGKKLTQDEFIERCKLVHGDKYCYDKTIYINSKTCSMVFSGRTETFIGMNASDVRQATIDSMNSMEISYAIN